MTEEKKQNWVFSPELIFENVTEEEAVDRAVKVKAFIDQLTKDGVISDHFSRLSDCLEVADGEDE